VPGTGTTWAIVVAAGSGTRFGEPKQFALLDGTRLVDRAIATATAACDGVVLVVPGDRPWDGPPVHATVVGGASRSGSVRAGLAALPDDAEVIVVHDAARPLASAALFAAVIDAVKSGADGAVPALPVPDTVKRVDGARVTETLVRDELVAVQTPQAFGATILRRAHENEGDASDDAALVEAAGGIVLIVEGEAHNLKVTTPSDLALAAALSARTR